MLVWFQFSSCNSEVRAWPLAVAAVSGAMQGVVAIYLYMTLCRCLMQWKCAATRFLVSEGEQMHMIPYNQRCVLAAWKAWAVTKEAWPAGQGRWFSPSAPKLLSPCLESAQERCEPLLWPQAERVGLSSLEKRRTPHCGLSVITESI